MREVDLSMFDCCCITDLMLEQGLRPPSLADFESIFRDRDTSDLAI